VTVTYAAARGALTDDLVTETTLSRSTRQSAAVESQKWSGQDLWATWPAGQYVARAIDLVASARAADRQQGDDLDALDQALEELMEDLDTVKVK